MPFLQLTWTLPDRGWKMSVYVFSLELGYVQGPDLGDGISHYIPMRSPCISIKIPFDSF